MTTPLVSFNHLSVSFAGERTRVRAVQEVSFTIQAGQTVGVVGESGCGKSVTAMTLMGLLPPQAARIDGGEIRFADRDLLRLKARQMADLRGHQLAMIFQEPMSALNPVLTIGEQLCEPLIRHLGATPKAAWQQAIQLLSEVGLARGDSLMTRYPHQLSGGMLQRVMIAMALSCQPKLLIADEPTTALDVTVQAQILRLLRDRARASQMAMMLITHDLGVIAQMAEQVVVMYAGRIVEQGATAEVLRHPQHPYTRGLIASRPVPGERRRRLYSIPGQVPDLAALPAGCAFAGRCERATARCREAIPPLLLQRICGGDSMSERYVIEVDGLKKYFPLRDGLFGQQTGELRAVDGVSFNIRPGTIFGLVGESGSGKTTVGRTLLGLYEKSAGSVKFHGQELADLTAPALRAIRPRMQLVFQDPYSSLNPRLRIGDAIGEAMLQHKLCTRDELYDRVIAVMKICGLAPEHYARFPHQFSGGQRQRIGIARALILNPDFIVADEPISALDVSIQAQIINLFSDLRDERGVTFLFISHDLGVVEHLCDDVAVMYLGQLVESASRDALFSRPLHPYTRALLAAVPTLDPHSEPQALMQGEIPDPANPPPGCRFSSRCPQVSERCRREAPALREVAPGHRVACHGVAS